MVSDTIIFRRGMSAIRGVHSSACCTVRNVYCQILLLLYLYANARPASCTTVVGIRSTLGYCTGTQGIHKIADLDAHATRSKRTKHRVLTVVTEMGHLHLGQKTPKKDHRTMCALPLQAGSICACGRHGPCAPIAQSR